jgi:hypothetical protein
VTGTAEAPGQGHDATLGWTLVWIDAREAVVARWCAGEALLERFRSDVPAHRRATGHVRYDPAVRHGGGAPHDAGEANRLEHLARFVDFVARQVPPDDDLLILGPGTVRDRLARLVHEADRHASSLRGVTCEAAARLTDRQLAARLRHRAGIDRRPRASGAHRWTGISAAPIPGPKRPPSRRPIRRPETELETENLVDEDVG